MVYLLIAVAFLIATCFNLQLYGLPAMGSCCSLIEDGHPQPRPSILGQSLPPWSSDEFGGSSLTRRQAGELSSTALVLADLPIPPGIIPTLELLGCEAYPIMDDPILKFHPDSDLITFYEVKKHGRQKAKLGVYTNPEDRLQSTKLYVYSIYMDPLRTAARRGESRVKGHQILMAFWTYTLRRDPRMLRRLYFESVLEAQTTELFQQQIWPRLGKPCIEGEDAVPWETISVYRPSGAATDRVDATEDELIVWGSLVGEIGSGSRLVKIALHMCAAYPQLDGDTGVVVQVERIIFRPKIADSSMSRPAGYDLEICMGVWNSLARRFVKFAMSSYYACAGEEPIWECLLV